MDKTILTINGKSHIVVMSESYDDICLECSLFKDCRKNKITKNYCTPFGINSSFKELKTDEKASKPDMPYIYRAENRQTRVKLHNILNKVGERNVDYADCYRPLASYYGINNADLLNELKTLIYWEFNVDINNQKITNFETLYAIIKNSVKFDETKLRPASFNKKDICTYIHFFLLSDVKKCFMSFDEIKSFKIEDYPRTDLIDSLINNLNIRLQINITKLPLETTVGYIADYIEILFKEK